MEEEKKSLSYKVGYALATTIGICIDALIIALTIKLILWMF